MMALLAHVVTRLWPPPRFSVMRVFGQTSLLVYWVHVELVYGLLFKRLREPAVDGRATVGVRPDDGGDAGAQPVAHQALARLEAGAAWAAPEVGHG